MRRCSLFAFVVVSASMACGPSSTNQGTAYGPVTITANCMSDGTLGDFSISSWAVRLPDKHAAFRFINKGNVDAVIEAQDKTYPFGPNKLKSPKGSHVDGRPVPDTPDGTYKYSITVSCQGPAGSKDYVIDPDMIIPWKIERN